MGEGDIYVYIYIYFILAHIYRHIFPIVYKYIDVLIKSSVKEYKYKAINMREVDVWGEKCKCVQWSWFVSISVSDC